MKTLNFPHKQLRAEVIRDYIYRVYGPDKKIICFSCGNASDALKFKGLNVLDIGTHGAFTPNYWFEQAEINYLFPDYFDATCGHLSMEVMLKLAHKYKQWIDDNYDELDDEYDIYCGSGETLVCLKLAYPNIAYNAVYNVPSLLAETEYYKYAPLNKLVELLAKSVIIN